MAIGKNKKIGKKQNKKKIIDPFSKKNWFDIKAPSNFEIRDIGKTPVTKYSTPKEINDSLVGRSIWVSLGDLKDTHKDAFRKFCFRVQSVIGNKCLTTFNGMDITTDKLKSIVKKWTTLIEANVDVKTTDGFLLRFFAIGFTRRAKNQIKKTSYAKRSQVSFRPFLQLWP
ncbi:ribosomal 40S subunit protein S1B [Bonamia ostreae]|uniref:Ribosomal 40S subunit protein S1B n=1 Tax=Bonamia ostreae TaxID=126728 RepID=A0ABV2AH72_9EUKA